MLLRKYFELIIKLFGKNPEAPCPFGGWGRDGGREDVSLGRLGRFLPIKGVKLRRGSKTHFVLFWIGGSGLGFLNSFCRNRSLS